MSTKIIIDSTVDLPAALRAQAAIVPLTVRFGEEEYQDSVTIDHEQFYKKLIVCKDLPSTSQPSPDAFAQVYQSVVDAGDEAVVLTVSSKLSGTYQSACIAAEDVHGIYVVDTMTVAIASGILAELALQMAAEGLDAKTIAQRLETEKGNIRLFAVLDTLEFLKRGGRLSATAALAGSLLNIKPIITIQDGCVEVIGKARGLRRGNAMMTEEVAKTGGVDYEKPFLLGYTGLSDELLKNYMADNTELWPADARVTPIGSAIGTHGGPGAYAVAYFCKNS